MLRLCGFGSPDPLWLPFPHPWASQTSGTMGPVALCSWHAQGALGSGSLNPRPGLAIQTLSPPRG